MRSIAILAYSAMFLSAGSLAALAAPSCTNWITQPDGTQWRTCVGDDGHQYCQQKVGNQINTVPCK